VQVVLGDPNHHRRDLVLLIAVDHTQIQRAGQAYAAPTAAGRKQLTPPVRSVGEGQPGARRAGLLAPRPPRPTPRRGFCGAGGLPGSSSREGGLEELPELRDNRCSTRASFAVSASLAARNSAIWRAWTVTTTSNSSRDISSGAGTRRSNRTRADHPGTDTPEQMTSTDSQEDQQA
jgi:hypothetical protein